MEIVNKLIPDPAERARLQAQLQSAAVDGEARLAEAQAGVLTAEAQGNWMQRSWRPLLMFMLMGVIVWHATAVPLLAHVLGVTMTDLVGLAVVPGEVWTLLTIGMGGYIAGRTVEKVFDKN